MKMHKNEINPEHFFSSQCIFILKVQIAHIQITTLYKYTYFISEKLN